MRGRALIGGLTVFGTLGAAIGLVSRGLTTAVWSLAGLAGHGAHGAGHWRHRTP